MDVEKLKSLIQERERIDAEIVAAVTGTKTRKLTCSKCGSDQHTARNCTVVQSS